MKEKPIIFSAPMVQAQLNTKPNVWPAEPIDPSKPFKWMTRRVIDPQPQKVVINQDVSIVLADGGTKQTAHPYKPGDILWVREAWHVTSVGSAGNTDMATIEYKAGGRQTIDITADRVSYYAGKARWRHSIHMPREAARLFLEVKNVRVERVQGISEKDALAEGCDSFMLFQWVKANYTEPKEAPCWISGNNEVEERVSFCAKCGKQEVRRLQEKYPEDKDDIVLCGGVDPYEDDSPTVCELCGKRLTYVPTEDCIQGEYEERWKEFGLKKSDSYLLEQLAWNEDFFKEYPGMSRILFRRTWDDLNEKRGYPWKSNPWVWVYEFGRVE